MYCTTSVLYNYCTVQLVYYTTNGKEKVKKYFLHYEEIEVQVGKSFLSIAAEKNKKIDKA